jgi:alginate O-acetyltransferase complex protein AlgI
VRFPPNFAQPYQSASLTDFWRRWHISLSTWLRDYLYVPLGGNRRGSGRTYVNLMLTMLLGGLWHGAAWTFVFWGFLHGLGLGVNRFVERRSAKASRALSQGGPWARARASLRDGLGVILTFHWVCFAWIFFRAPTFSTASSVLGRLVSGTTFHPNLPPLVMVLLAVGFVAIATPSRAYHALRRTFCALPAPVQAVALFAVAVVLHELSSAEAVPFVYFQF